MTSGNKSDLIIRVKNLFWTFFVLIIGLAAFFIYKSTNSKESPKNRISVDSNSSRPGGNLGKLSENNEKNHVANPQSGETSFEPEYLKKLHAGTIYLSLEEAKDLLDRAAKQISNVDKRTVVFSLVVRCLCKQGKFNDAWSIISSDPGHVRQGQLNSFFSCLSELPSSQISAFLQQVSDKEEREHAVAGLIGTKPELLGDPAFYQNIQVDGGDDSGITTAVRIMMASEITALQKEELLNSTIKLAAFGKLHAVSLLHILDSHESFDAFAKWDAVSKYRNAFPDSEEEEILSGLAKRLVNENLEKAMGILCNDPSTKYSYRILSAAVTEMYRTIPSNANAWMTKNLDGIDPATAQRITSCLAQTANQNLEFETSRMWANKILNAEVRQQLLEQVDKREAEKAQKPMIK